MNKCTLKELIDELTLIYNKYGDIGVCKDDECGGLLYIYIYIYPEFIRVTDYSDKEGNITKYVEL